MDQTTKDAIRQILEEFWEERSVLVEETGTVEDLIDELDSLSAVDALLPIEELVGTEIEASRVIRRGGYDSKEQFIDHLTHSVERYVEEHQA